MPVWAVSFNFAWMRAALVRCIGSTPTQRTAHPANPGQTIVIVPVRRFETGFSVWLTRQISGSRHRVGAPNRRGKEPGVRCVFCHGGRPHKCRGNKVGSATRETISRPAGRRSKLSARTRVAQVGKGNFGLVQDDGVFVAYFCATNCFARLSSGRVEFEPSQTFSNSA
jgi:hypothetical protein